MFVGTNLLPGKGTKKRLSIWKDVNLSGSMVEVRGGTSDGSYLSLAEVEVYGIKSELTYSLVDFDGTPRINGVLVVNINNHIKQKACFYLYIDVTADFICKSLSYGTQIETKFIKIENPTKGEVYVTGADCFKNSSLMQCNYYLTLADVFEDMTYISCSCTEQMNWYGEFCVACPCGSTSSADIETCFCPPLKPWETTTVLCNTATLLGNTATLIATLLYNTAILL